MPVTDVLTTQRVLALMHGLLDDRASLAPEIQARLDESVVEFVAYNPIALSAILHNPPLLAEHPETMRRLLQRAYERAPKPEDRQWVANQARLAGHPELIPAAPTAAVQMALAKSQSVRARRAGPPLWAWHPFRQPADDPANCELKRRSRILPRPRG